MSPSTSPPALSWIPGGCRALLRAAQIRRTRSARLFVVNHGAAVARILTVMGLDEFVEIVESRDEIRPAAPTL